MKKTEKNVSLPNLNIVQIYITTNKQYIPYSKAIKLVLENKTNIAFARGGAHLAHACRMLSTQELRFGLTKLKLRRKERKKF